MAALNHPLRARGLMVPDVNGDGIRQAGFAMILGKAAVLTPAYGCNRCIVLYEGAEPRLANLRRHYCAASRDTLAETGLPICSYHNWSYIK